MASMRDLVERELAREVYAKFPARVPVLHVRVPYAVAARLGLFEARYAEERTAGLLACLPDNAGVLSLLQLTAALRRLL